MDFVILRVLERLQARLQQHSVVLAESFRPHCSGCLPAGKVEGVPACWAGNDGLTVVTSCWSMSAGRYRCFNTLSSDREFAMVILGVLCGLVSAHGASSNCTQMGFLAPDGVCFGGWVSFRVCLVLLGRLLYGGMGWFRLAGRGYRCFKHHRLDASAGSSINSASNAWSDSFIVLILFWGHGFHL